MPAKKLPDHKPAVHHQPDPLVPPASPDPSLFPPLADQPEEGSPDAPLRLSPEVETPVAQLASIPANPEPIVAPPAYQTAPVEPPAASSAAPQSKSKVSWVVVIVALVIGLTLAGYAVFHLLSGKTTSGTVSVVVPQPSPVPASPSPLPSPVLERSGLKIEILNGSGIPGLAGKAKDYLTDLGYADIASANADTYDFTSTQVSLKADKELYRSLIMSDLQANYSLSSQIATLSADSSFDIVITLGQK